MHPSIKKVNAYQYILLLFVLLLTGCQKKVTNEPNFHAAFGRDSNEIIVELSENNEPRYHISIVTTAEKENSKNVKTICVYYSNGVERNLGTIELNKYWIKEPDSLIIRDEQASNHGNLEAQKSLNIENKIAP